MRIYTKYRAIKPRRKEKDLFYLLLSALGLAVLAWVFWKTAWPSTGAPARPGSTATVVRPVAAPSARLTNPWVLSLPNAPLPSSNSDTKRREPGDLGRTHENVASLLFEPRPARDILEAQIALAREGISSGSIDGRLGTQTRAALLAFQEIKGLPKSGILDSNTQAELRLRSPPLSHYIVAEEDLEGLRPVPSTWQQKAQLKRLGYETILELVAEKSRAHPELIRRLNPAIEWAEVKAGWVVQVPEASYPTVKKKAAAVKIQLSKRMLQAYDEETNLLAHFPCSIARRVDKRPLGTLRVASLVLNPNYVFNPEVFPESEEGREIGHKLILPPGPNGPVGEVWIGLDKPGYGIHGTPRPEEVGRTESHGCFRLANWNAEYLVQLVRVGTPVVVSP